MEAVLQQSLAYLEAEVMSASGPQLRLILIEAALRLARQSLTDLEQARLEAALDKLGRARKIFFELLNSVGDGPGEIAENIRRVYTYLVCVVTEAQLCGDSGKVDEVIRVLKVERETWREVSARYLVEMAKRLGSSPGGAAGVPATRTGAGGGLCIEA